MRINCLPSLLAWLPLAVAGAAWGQSPMGLAVPAPTGIVTLRSAAGAALAENGHAAPRPVAAEPAAANVPPPAPAPAAAVVTPLPPAAASRPPPDVVLMRISSLNGVQKATLFVKGATRSGLTVGDRVLKLVLSEFRDDGICLDVSLQHARCATFVGFSYE